MKQFANFTFICSPCKDCKRGKLGQKEGSKRAAPLRQKKKRHKNSRSYVFLRMHLQGLEPWAHWLRDIFGAFCTYSAFIEEAWNASIHADFCVVSILHCLHQAHRLAPFIQPFNVQKMCRNVQWENLANEKSNCINIQSGFSARFETPF
jgi:hypothetical protein